MKQRFFYCGVLFPVVVSELNLWPGIAEFPREHLIILGFFLSFLNLLFKILFSFPHQLQGVQKCPG